MGSKAGRQEGTMQPPLRQVQVFSVKHGWRTTSIAFRSEIAFKTWLRDAANPKKWRLEKLDTRPA